MKSRKTYLLKFYCKIKSVFSLRLNSFYWSPSLDPSFYTFYPDCGEIFILLSIFIGSIEDELKIIHEKSDEFFRPTSEEKKPREKNFIIFIGFLLAVLETSSKLYTENIRRFYQKIWKETKNRGRNIGQKSANKILDKNPRKKILTQNLRKKNIDPKSANQHLKCAISCVSVCVCVFLGRNGSKMFVYPSRSNSAGKG